MSKITISTLNVRGLVSNEKRREVFHWLKKKKFSIYVLQEAHCMEKSSEIWAAEWGYTALFSSLYGGLLGPSKVPLFFYFDSYMIDTYNC